MHDLCGLEKRDGFCDAYDSKDDYSSDGVGAPGLSDSESESEDTHGGRFKNMKNDAARQHRRDNAQRLDRIEQEKINNETRASQAGPTSILIIPEPERIIAHKHP